MSPMTTIAIIPAYNEETRIASVVCGARKYVDVVIVVDDGSCDRTGMVAAQTGAFVVTHMENMGAGAATMTGIEVARHIGADTVVTLDADEQHDPESIPSLLRPVTEGRADIVFANRFGQKNKIPVIRRVLNALGNVLTFLVTGKWVQDSQCGFKVFGSKALRDIDLKMRGFEFCSEIVIEAVQYRWRIVEVPIKVMYSEYTLAKGQSFALGIKTALRLLLRSLLR